MNDIKAMFLFLDETPHHHQKQRAAPPPPPPLSPRGGTDQQQLQRKSLTSRWHESKQDSDDEGSTQSDTDDHQQRTHFGHSKPYGDSEIIDEQTRRSLETMTVVKEEPEEETEDVGTVRLLSRKTLDDDSGGTVHRSDFLKVSHSNILPYLCI